MTSPRYHFLDSLRGIAIAGVLLIHVTQQIPTLPGPLRAFGTFGFSGVHLFFLVSALTLSLVSRPESFSARSFYIRRFFRIAPMFYLAAIFYLAVRSLGVMDLAHVPVAPIDVVSTFLLLHGLDPHGINNVVPGGWSIAAEALFYLIFPLLLTRLRDMRWMAALVAVAAVAYVVNRGIGRHFDYAQHGAYWRYYFDFDFAACLIAFAAGAMLYCLYAQGLFRIGEAPRRRANGAALLVLALMVAFACLSARIPFATLLFVPLQALLVWIAMCFQPGLIVNRGLSLLGEISFSVYLVHFALLHAVTALIPMPANAILHLVLLYAATLATSAAIAYISYTIVERPMVAIGHRLSRRQAAAAPAPIIAEPATLTSE